MDGLDGGSDGGHGERLEVLGRALAAQAAGAVGDFLRHLRRYAALHRRRGEALFQGAAAAPPAEAARFEAALEAHREEAELLSSLQGALGAADPRAAEARGRRLERFLREAAGAETREAVAAYDKQS